MMKRTTALVLVTWTVAQVAGLALTSPTPLASLVRSYRGDSTPAGRALIENYARTHARETSGAMAHFALGVASFENKDYPTALQELTRARLQLPALADYVTYYVAAAQDAQGDATGAAATLGGLADLLTFRSPLLAKATILAAQDGIKSGKPDPDGLRAAVQALRLQSATLPQPEGDFALALAYDLQGEGALAATYYQRVYFLRPATKMAADASAAIERLKQSLGSAYAPAVPALLLERGQKWIEAKEYGKARAEFEAIAPLLKGVEQEQARVRIGAAQYAGGDYRGAYQYLKALELPHDEAGAERWYWIGECARRMDRDDEMMEAIKDLGRHHERSVWRLKALVSAGNRYLVTHQPDRYEPLYRAAWVTFPSDSSTAYCHWKITWDSYLANKHDARELLREQVEKYPGDNKAGTALYYLGRESENGNDYQSARAYYERLTVQFPNFYYAVLARERLATPKFMSVTPALKVTEWLDAIEFPEHPDYSTQAATETTSMRIERIRLLASAGLNDFADAEVRFGARTDGQPHLLAVELARTDAATYVGLQHMKSLVPDYLSTPVDKAPKPFWQMLFPLPYSSELIASARRQNLDPYMVAALIRQESEFNPGAHSHANAYGLTQIVPATGRMLARQQGIRGFSVNLLYEPTTNLRLGTQYIRSLLDQWNGKWEQTLAAYNAGPGRVKEWLAWSNYREPSEFVESIPFTETREYVQAVIRNAAMYRQIYGPTPQLEAGEPEPAPVIKKSSAPRLTRKASVHVMAVNRGKARSAAQTNPHAKTSPHAKTTSHSAASKRKTPRHKPQQ